MSKVTGAEGASKSFYIWQGVLSILVGVLVLVWPGITLLTLVTLLSIWLLFAGVINIVDGVISIKKGGFAWLASILFGILQLGIGAYLVQRPKLTALTVITLVGLVFIVQGCVYLVRTFFAKELHSGQRLLSLLFAALSLIAGVWVWRYPVQGSLAFVWLIGLYTIASGALLIASSGAADQE